MEIWVIVLGTVIILLMLWGLMRGTRQELLSPEEVLQEVEIYRSYGRYKDAIKVLQRGLERYPKDPMLLRTLEEIEQY
ncbi:MAG: tetratricopeptide repeat protein [Alcanivoracaceae bacterium]|nr:tetratricopeptide repeat protein [Alcanivoracaceae bacterium]